MATMESAFDQLHSVCDIDTLEPTPVPAEVALVLSALEAGGFGLRDRRSTRRIPFRMTTQMRLLSDATELQPRVLYTRDVNRRSVGFITRHRLPLGYGGTVDLPGADGRIICVHCTVLRCREASAGWYEGSVYFNRDQPQFDQ